MPRLPLLVSLFLLTLPHELPDLCPCPRTLWPSRLSTTMDITFFQSWTTLLAFGIVALDPLPHVSNQGCRRLFCNIPGGHVSLNKLPQVIILKFVRLHEDFISVQPCAASRMTSLMSAVCDRTLLPCRLLRFDGGPKPRAGSLCCRPTSCLSRSGLGVWCGRTVAGPVCALILRPPACSVLCPALRSGGFLRRALLQQRDSPASSQDRAWKAMHVPSCHSEPKSRLRHLSSWNGCSTIVLIPLITRIRFRSSTCQFLQSSSSSCPMSSCSLYSLSRVEPPLLLLPLLLLLLFF